MGRVGSGSFLVYVAAVFLAFGREKMMKQMGLDPSMLKMMGMDPSMMMFAAQ